MRRLVALALLAFAPIARAAEAVGPRFVAELRAGRPQPLMLQSHGNVLQFRHVWVLSDPPPTAR
jgi:hypothetical protein